MDTFRKLTGMLTKAGKNSLFFLYIFIFIHSCSPESPDLNKIVAEEKVSIVGRLVGVNSQVLEYCTLQLCSCSDIASANFTKKNIPIKIKDDGSFQATVRISDKNVPSRFIFQCGGYRDFVFEKKVSGMMAIGIIRPRQILTPWFVPIQGECGDDAYSETEKNINQYRLLLGLYQKNSKYINIRPRPAFNRHDPIVTKLPNGIWVPADGPIKNPDYGNALSFKIPLKDSRGKKCIGYVSASVTRGWPSVFFNE